MAGHDEQVLNKLTVQWLLLQLTDEERAIIELFFSGEYNFSEIGEIVGRKYRGGRILSGSAIRYHKIRIIGKLRNIMGE